MPTLFDSDEFNQRLFFPRADASPPPPSATDIHVAVAGASLHLRWHRQHMDAPTVLLFHGNGEVVADYDSSADLFAAFGASLAVVDYRGYGQSTGVPTFRNMLADSEPVRAAMVAAGAKRLVLMGRSLGSQCVAELYPRAPDVAGVIWESGFIDLDAMIRRRRLPARRAPTAVEREPFDPLPKLRRGTRPFLVIHGEQDTAISCEEGRKAFREVRAEKKNLLIVPGRGHNDVSRYEGYYEAIGQFIASLD